MCARRASRFVVSVSMAAAFVTAVLPVGAAPTFSQTVIAGGPSMLFPAPMQSNPEMDGRYVVYEYTPGFDIGTIDTDIRAYDIATGETILITDREGDDDANQIRPDLSVDTVVYQSNELLHTNVFLYNIGWSSARQVTNETHAQTRPRISGRYVIWHDANTNALKYYATYWPQYMNQQIPGTVGVYGASWDIDGDTVVFAREHAGNVTFYKWTVWSDAMPKAFGTHTGAGSVADVRLHNGRIVYTYGAGLDSVGVMALHDGSAAPLGAGVRDADLFHDVWAFETIVDGDILFVRHDHWNTTIGSAAYVESNPSVFGNRVAFERDTYNGDVILSTASEPLVDRTSGDDRYATAVAASQEYFEHGADNVVLCTGENFPDALAAAPWARFLEAPVLLTKGKTVPSVVMDEIARLGAANVWIVGGEGAVSSAVTAQLEGAGLYVDRQLKGADRYATSAKIAMFLHDAVTADGRPFSAMAFVARGDAFPDALAVAPVAAATYSPVILVKPQVPVPQPSAQVFESLPIKHVFIAGGTDVVSAEVEVAIEGWATTNLGAYSPATRMEGPDRYATAVAVLQDAVASNWLDLDTVGFATGTNFPDALGGGAALGFYGSPLLLTRPTSLPAPVAGVLEQRAAQIGRADIFGGTSVVSSAVYTSIVGLLE